MRRFIPSELQEAKIIVFLTLYAESMSVYEYSMMFSQIPHYDQELVTVMRSKMCLFVIEFPHHLRKEGKEAMLVADMDIARLIIHVQQLEGIS